MPTKSRPDPLTLACGRRLEFDQPRLMGIVNVTPDSFSDGGQFGGVEDALLHALSLEASGACILDVGGESTRPGSSPVSSEEQKRRVVPVIRAIRERSKSAISVDTTDAAVAAAALEAGASMVNDISAFRFDPDMLPLLARTGCPAIAMHTRGRPANMQDAPRYEDVVEEVLEHLRARVAAAIAAGVKRHQLVVDPGIGFGKTLEHNLALLKDLGRFRQLGLGILVGTSRKRMIGDITGLPIEERDPASATLAALSVTAGAHWVRVHNVAASKDAVAIAGAIAGSS